MTFVVGQKVILKVNNLHVWIGKVVLRSTNCGPPHLGQVFVRAMRVDYGLNQLVINYPHIGNCIGNSVGSPIPWAIENLVICGNEIFETSINSSSKR